MPCFMSGDKQCWCGSVDSYRIMDGIDDPHELLLQKIKENIGVNTYTAHRYTDFTTHDAVVTGSTDTPNTRLIEQTLTEP